MGRGRSKAGGAAYAPTNIDTSNGASFKTVELIEKATAAKADDSRSGVREALDQIAEGQRITTYSAEISRDSLDVIPGVANDPVVWTKMDDGTWRGDNGRRIENRDLARIYYNAGYGAQIAPGAINTESHVQVDNGGRGGRTIDGVRWTSGTYDVSMNGAIVGASGARKVERRGNMTTYNGTQYGVTNNGGSWTVTHVPTGMSIGEGKSMRDATALIKNLDSRVKNAPGLREIEDRFNRTIRGDYRRGAW